MREQRKSRTPQQARAELARRIEHYRGARGFTASAVAGQIGVSTAYLRNLERGRRAVAAITAIDIAGVLGVEVEGAATWLALALRSQSVRGVFGRYLIDVLDCFVRRQRELARGPRVSIRAGDPAGVLRQMNRCRESLAGLARQAGQTRVVEPPLRAGSFVALTGLIDLFEGGGRGLKRAAAARWFDELLPLEKCVRDRRRFVWRWAVLPGGGFVHAALQKRSRTGRRAGAMSPAAWRRFLCAHVGDSRTVTDAWDSVRRVASSRGWRWPSRRTVARHAAQITSDESDWRNRWRAA